MRKGLKKSDLGSVVVHRPITPVPQSATSFGGREALIGNPGYPHALEDVLKRAWATLQSSIGSLKNITEPLVQLAVFAAAFYLAYSASTARLWLPDAVLLVALLFTRPKRWWLFLLIPLIVRYAATKAPGLPFWLIPANYLNDILKALVGASILRWLYSGPPKLGTITGLLQFFLVAVILTPALSAFGGAATGWSLGREFWQAWQIWFLGDALANLILAPMLIFWLVDGIPDVRSAPKWRVVEGILLYGALIFLGYSATRGGAAELGSSPLMINLTFPLLLYAAVRFGPQGVSTAFFAVTAFVIWNTKQGRGPFAAGAADMDIVWIQLVFYVVSIPLLGIAVLLRESARNEKAARDNHRKAQELSGRLIHLQEEERQRIASELHDSLGQQLTLIQICATSCVNDVANPKNLVEQLYEITATASAASKEVRKIAHNLRPFELDRLGVTRSIELVVDKFATSSSIDITADLDLVDKLLPPEAETGLYRIVQEALNNLVKHSKATEASVTITHTSGGLEVVIEDNGVGMDLSTIQAAGSGFGLSGIAERVRLIGGKLRINSSPGKGTRLVVQVEGLGKRETWPGDTGVVTGFSKPALKTSDQNSVPYIRAQ